MAARHDKANGVSVEIAEISESRLALRGALTFKTAKAAYEQGLAILRARNSTQLLQIDCADIRNSDSAGLAVLVAWLADASARGQKIAYAHLPSGILASARISELDTWLE